jgi:hypothetical protein
MDTTQYQKNLLSKIISKEMLRIKPTNMAQAVLSSIVCGGVAILISSLFLHDPRWQTFIGLAVASALTWWSKSCLQEKLIQRNFDIQNLLKNSPSGTLVGEWITTNPAKPRRSIKVSSEEESSKLSTVTIPAKRWEKIKQKARRIGLETFIQEKK